MLFYGVEAGSSEVEIVRWMFEKIRLQSEDKCIGRSLRVWRDFFYAYIQLIEKESFNGS